MSSPDRETALPGPLAGRTALVTGGSSGIGAATALALGRSGAAVAVVGRRAHLLEEVADGIRREGGLSVCIPCDLTGPDGPVSAVRAARERLGPIQILVNAAGVARLGRLEDVTDRQWDLLLRLNLTVPFQLVKEVLPDMKSSGGGWFVAIGSDVGCSPVPCSGAYGVSKSALNRLVELVDAEYRDDGIRSVAVCPGWVRTDLAAVPEALRVTPEEILTPQDVAGAVTWMVTSPARIRLGPVVPITPAASRADTLRAVDRYVTGARREGYADRRGTGEES
jgi:NAD(P)-dependent dehydrogenase (short-subunit alcohol dehydrogenase family)